MREVKMANVARQGSGLMVRLLVGGVVVIAAVSAAISAQAQGHHGRMGAMSGAPGMMMMFGGSAAHMDSSVDRMLDGLKATDAQRSQIKQIATAAAADLKAQHEAARGLHDKAMAIFTAPTVDAAAAEALRQQVLAQHDQASKRVLQAMLDVSKVLTSEQRAKIGERMQQRQAMMRDRMQRMQREHHAPAQK